MLEQIPRVRVRISKDVHLRACRAGYNVGCSLRNLVVLACFGVFFGVLFCRGVGEKPFFLLVDELGGGVAKVANGFEGEFAGDTVGFVVRRGLDGRGPALGGVDELGQGFADVEVAGAVVVEVVVELVGDESDLFEEVVGVLLAAGAAGLCVEVLDGFDAGVDEFDEEEDALGG